MKKLIALLLALVMVLGLVACGETDTDTNTTDPAVNKTMLKTPVTAKFSRSP